MGDQKGDQLETASNLESVVKTAVPAALPQLCDYVDYRAFLRDFYDYKKRTESTLLRPYTYSVFSAAADIRSPNYLKLVIEGQRNLSEQMAVKFARAMRMNKAQCQEFCMLVRYGQERDPQERAKYLRILAEFRFQNQIDSGKIDPKATELVPNWLTYVLFQMVDQEGVEFKPESLREIIRTQTHIEEIRRAFDRLLEAGLLTRNADDGHVFKSKELVDDAQSVPTELVKKIQSELIYLGMESLFNDAPTDREFGAMTAALTEEEFNRFKFELRQFRKKWQKEVAVNRKSTKGERVYQLNIQLFPLTAKK